MKLAKLVTPAVILAILAGCSYPDTAYKGRTPTGGTNQVVRPVKLSKNDPDHVFFLYPDGTVGSQVWTNAAN